MSDRENRITVVYDRNNAASAEIAQAYSDLRSKDWDVVPLGLGGIKAAWVEDKVSYANAMRHIIEPVWASDPGRYIVTCWGIPLKNYTVGYQDPYWAIDDTLHLPPPGSQGGWYEASPVHQQPDMLAGDLPAGAEEFRFVGRIDGPTIEIARDILRRVQHAERYGWTSGIAMVDGSPYTTWEAPQTVAELEAAGGWTVLKDYGEPSVDVFPPPGFWWGWHAAYPGQDLSRMRFPPIWMGFGRGSSTAQKLHTTYFSCGKILSLGAFATIGAVREPLDAPYTYANFFVKAFIGAGQTLGRAFSYATPWIRWQLILVGDPVMTMPQHPAHWNVAPFIPPQEMAAR